MDIIERFNQIEENASDSRLEAIRQERSIVFRLPEKAVKRDTWGCLLFFSVWTMLIIGIVVQFLKSPFSWLAGVGLAILACYGYLNLTRHDTNKSERVYFTIDGNDETITIRQLGGDKTIHLNDIDYFVFSDRRNDSEPEIDTRLVTLDGANIILHYMGNEKLACMLGYLCDKPAYRRKSEKLTTLALPDRLQVLLRPANAPDLNVDLVVPVHHSPSIAPNHLLRADTGDEEISTKGLQ